jgi:ketosteroid isomerase-like protein
MSQSSSLAVAEHGFDAWRRGDFDAVEAIFAPKVEWRWFEPGDWTAATATT